MNISTFNNFFKQYRLHFFIWGIYIIYEVFILGLSSSKFRPVGVYILIYTTNIVLFYSHAFLLNKILEGKPSRFKAIKIPLLIIFIIGGYILFSFGLGVIFIKLGFIKSTRPMNLDHDFIMACLFRAIYYTGFSTGYVYLVTSFKERKKVEQLERQSLVTQIEKQTLENDLVQSQNNFLRSQINPHFLFNTLNFIYNDARKKAPMAADAIMNLSEMMRYALKRPEASELVPLSEEIEQIEHLINLHKLRTANLLNVELEINGDLFGLRFPPLIMLTLVENIFKHGNIAHSTQPAIISVDYHGNHLSIKTINMVNDVKSKKIESHHVGIENIEKRLNNFYKDNFEFKYYTDQQNRYITEINVTVVNLMANLNIN
ncbi:sensor histidine kinase [Pedobacter fastidiosus]|uniref:Sensor histidine kinase n=1 Tax=Pedobacter fastidiosus TaxID=2765361 RepID=A0ABR7KLX7_9SPHI|nr:sensor histidine kinase [Pedobacter fastidiosus]MBC6109083.1 sensor histidine kinase [Pedobacter fastidiosus]